MRRRAASGALRLAVVAVTTVALVACGSRGFTREQLERRYVDLAVEEGIERDVAECVIGRLFGEMTDEQLRAFNTTGDELTVAEQARVAELADACAAAGP